MSIIVVLTSAWPRSSWTVRMSYTPSSSKCAANECLNVWQPTRFGITRPSHRRTGPSHYRPVAPSDRLSRREFKLRYPPGTSRVPRSEGPMTTVQRRSIAAAILLVASLTSSCSHGACRSQSIVQDVVAISGRRRLVAVLLARPDQQVERRAARGGVEVFRAAIRGATASTRSSLTARCSCWRRTTRSWRSTR